MEMTNAMNVLTENGISVKRTTVTKEGREKDALAIGTGSIVPTIYEENIVNIHNEDEMLRFAMSLTKQIPSVDVDSIFTREFFLSHVKSCVRPYMEDESTLTYTVYGDLQEYFRVYLDGFHDDSIASVVVLKQHIRQLGIEADELREAARKNLRKDVEIMPMSKVLASMMGDMPELPEVDELMYVASNKERCNGASVMLLDDVLRDFCNQHEIEHLSLIPCSRHEVLLIKGSVNSAEVNAIIGEVNDTTVSETDQLSDHVYEFSAV